MTAGGGLNLPQNFPIGPPRPALATGRGHLHIFPMTRSALPDPILDAQFYDGVPVKRLIAWCVDVLVVAGLILLALLASVGLLVVVFPVLAFTLNLIYRAWTVQRWSATPGMRTVGLELRNRQGDKLSPFEAVAHSIIYILVFATLIGALVNAVMMLVTDRGQGLHDMILGTTAINRPENGI